MSVRRFVSLFVAAAAGVVAVLALAGCQPGQALHLQVTSATDGGDAHPGDGTCATAAGACTLRAAIDEANAWPGTDSITIATGVDPVLSIVGRGEDANVSGDLDITDRVTIDGGGAHVSAAHIDRVFDLQGGSGSTLRHLAISDGSAQFENGGGIRSRPADIGPVPALVLDDVTISDSQAFSGGGLSTIGSVGVIDSTFRSNRAQAGGAIWTEGNTPQPTRITLLHATVADNTATFGSSGGIGAILGTNEINVFGSTLSGNTAVEGGAAITISGGPLTVLDSAIVGNSVTGKSSSGFGGGIYSLLGGRVTIRSSTVSGNSVVGNGGGVAVLDGATSITTSTIEGNTATQSGGGLWLADGSTVTASTVTGNTAFAGAGIAESTGSTGQPFVLSGTVLDDPGNDCAQAVTSLGWNVSSDTSCALSQPSDRSSTASGLGALADNGGPALTRLPAVGSALLDAIPVGTPGLCDGTIAVDQRGVARPEGTACDIGAVERSP